MNIDQKIREYAYDAKLTILSSKIIYNSEIVRERVRDDGLIIMRSFHEVLLEEEYNYGKWYITQLPSYEIMNFEQYEEKVLNDTLTIEDVIGFYKFVVGTDLSAISEHIIEYILNQRKLQELRDEPRKNYENEPIAKLLDNEDLFRYMSEFL